jgi:hypothetical protein
MPNEFYRSLDFHIPYLVQRMRFVSEPLALEVYSGIDSEFKMDYMGCAEFEWGALPQSLKHMRSHCSEKNLLISQITANLPDGTSLWYVGRPEEVPMAEALLHAEFDEEHRYRLFKEVPYIRERLQPKDDAPSWHSKYDGWWALNPVHTEPTFVPFALFVSETLAHRWKALLLTAP